VSTHQSEILVAGEYLVIRVTNDIPGIPIVWVHEPVDTTKRIR